MGKILVIAEKPSVGRDIAKVLKCQRKGDGYLEGEDYVISWAIGHLVTLSEPEDYNDAYKRWVYEALPIIPESIQIKPYDKTVKQLNILKGLMNRKDVEKLICATDSGREGELIFRYIYDYCHSKKPFDRLWISSMTDEAIQDGFARLKPSSAYDNLYHSARCRSESDWLVGINATRAYTTKNNVLLSIGRVQTPTLALIVNRQKEIDDFKPQDYFEVVADYGEFTGTWFDEKPSETKIMEQEKAKQIADKVGGEEGIVTSITKKKQKQQPPNLYDLTELQRDGNRFHSYTAQQVLTIAQGLYEKHKMITYPRTDSRYLSDDMVPTVKATMAKLNVPPYQKAVSFILDKGLQFSKRIIDNSKVTDHHAIIPALTTPKVERLSGDELNIYNLIVKRFIAVFYDPFEFETSEMVITVKDETFITKGKVVIHKGWKTLYKAAKGDEDQELPKLKKGDKVLVVGSEVLTKQTSPPKPYTEATLLSAMENAGRFIEDEELKEQLKESGFGTPATRAGIIERLIQVEYIVRKGKALAPTPKGVKLIEIVPEQLKSPETTGKWEKGLTKIAKGELESDKFMGSIEKFVRYLVQAASVTQNKAVFEESPRKGKKGGYRVKGEVYGKCPLCEDGQITENTKSFYCSNWQKKCPFSLWKNQLERHGHAVTGDMVRQLLIDKQIHPFEIRMPQTGEKRDATLVLSDKGQLELINMGPVKG